jgi:Holliday junction resolvase-like predicted endonuclease
MGFRVLGRRLRGRGFELDLVVSGTEGLMVVEVKGSHCLEAEALLERVDFWKLQRMRRGLGWVRREFGALPVAIGVVGVSFRGVSKGGVPDFTWAVVEAPTTDF